MTVNFTEKVRNEYHNDFEHSWEGFDSTPLNFDVVEKPVYAEGIEIPDKKVIFRADEGKLEYLSTVSKRYTIFKHCDIVSRVEQGMGLDTKDVSVKTILSHNGSKMYRIYTLNNYSVEVRPGDEISPSIRLVNSYDGSTAVSFFIDAVRLICVNGIIATRQFANMSYRHFGSKFDVNTFARNAQKLMEGFKHYSENWRQWTRESVSDDRAKLILNYMPVRFKPAVESRLDRNFDGTKWGLYNAFTEAITHDYIPTRSKTPDTQKINLGAEVTKIFATKWYWSADREEILEDLRKRKRIKTEGSD